MKNNLDYYIHYNNSHNHWKFKTLRRKYGWAGEGKFWALNNVISASDNCAFNINDVEKVESTAADLDLSVEEFFAFIEFLSKSTLRLVKNNNGFITTELTQESLNKVTENRSYQRDWKKKKKELNIEKGNSSIETTESNIETNNSNIDFEQTIVKNSIVKDITTAPTAFLTPEQLKESNLFRKPVIPSYDEVHQCFVRNGGNKEQSDAFYNKHQSTGWFINGSPIKAYTKLVPIFIQNWNKINHKNNGLPDGMDLASQKMLEKLNQSKK